MSFFEVSGIFVDLTGYCSNPFNGAGENIRIIITFLVLKHPHQSFQSHSGIHMFCRKGFKAPDFSRLNWMNTIFQISITCGMIGIDQDFPILNFSFFESGRKSICISVQGPQGPVSPISQKLSFLLPSESGLAVSISSILICSSSSVGRFSAGSPPKTGHINPVLRVPGKPRLTAPSSRQWLLS